MNLGGLCGQPELSPVYLSTTVSLASSSYVPNVIIVVCAIFRICRSCYGVFCCCRDCGVGVVLFAFSHSGIFFHSLLPLVLSTLGPRNCASLFDSFGLRWKFHSKWQ